MSFGTIVFFILGLALLIAGAEFLTLIMLGMRLVTVERLPSAP